jgi:hypothetical protein
MAPHINTEKLIGTLIAIGVFVVAGVFYRWAQHDLRNSVVFGLLVFAGFGILFATWFRK